MTLSKGNRIAKVASTWEEVDGKWVARFPDEPQLAVGEMQHVFEVVDLSAPTTEYLDGNNGVFLFAKLRIVK